MYPPRVPTGDPTRYPQTSEHGGTVPAPDVRRPAAASHAADSRPAAPAQPAPAESGHHTAGQTMSAEGLSCERGVSFKPELSPLQCLAGFGLSAAVRWRCGPSASWCPPKLG